MKFADKPAFKTLLVLVAAILTILFVSVTGGSSASADTDGPTYAYGNSSLVIDVDENKVLHVKENLRVGFLQSVAGLRRRIPAKTASYKNSNGKAVKSGSFLASISNVSASVKRKDAQTWETAQTDFAKNGTDYYLSIDNPNGRFDVWEQGHDERQYDFILEYDYSFSDDGAGDNAFAINFFDEVDPLWFYYDGDENNVARLSVTVNMPKEFDGTLAGVFFGKTDVSESAELACNGKTVTASVAFKDINGYSLRIPLSDGYFDTHVTYYPFYWWFVGLVGVIIIIELIMTYVYRGRKPVCPVEVTPPVVNPLHYSAYWHGYPQRKDVSTIILRWARMGCIKITKDGKRDLILTKLKPLPEECTVAEEQYFNELFRYGDKFYSRETRGRENRARKNGIRYKVNALIEESEKPTPFVPQVERTKMYVDILSVMSLAVVFTYFILLCKDWIWLTVLVPFLFAAFLPLIKLFPLSGEMRKLKQISIPLFRGISFVALFGLFPFWFLLYILFATQYMPQYDYIHLTVISIALVAVSFFILPKFIKKRTKEANELYGKMLGFKRFIQLVKLPQMELILQENPDYYYDVLPYCMVMGLSKKLDRQMSNLNVAVPDWADGFSPAKFAEELFYSVKHAIVTRKKKDKKSTRRL